MRSTRAIILCGLLLFGSLSPGNAKAEPLVLVSGQEWYLLSPHLDYLEDPNGELTISDVSSPEYDTRFTPCESDVLVFGLTRSAYWVRFRLRRAPEQNAAEVNEWVIDTGKTVIDYIDLYVPLKPHPVDREDFIVKRAGIMRPPGGREVVHRNYVFRLPANFTDDAYFYMRMASSVEIHLPSFVRSRDNFERLAFWDNLAFGGLYGVMIGMAFYNLFIFFSLRDRTYFYYVLYICSILLFQTCEFGQLAVLADLREEWQMILLWIFVGSTLIWGATFNRSFLLTRVNTPFLDKCILAFIVIANLVVLLGLIGYHRQANLLAHFLGLLGGVLGLSTGIIVLRQGFQPARYYLLAWSVLIIGLVLWSSRGMGWMRPTFLTTYTLSIGAAAESVLLSFALADRIRALRKEKDALARSRERSLLSGCYFSQAPIKV